MSEEQNNIVYLHDEEENEAYCTVEDPAALAAVFECFKEKYKDIFDFEG